MTLKIRSFLYKDILFPLLIIFVGFITFWNSLRNGFVWTDPIYTIPLRQTKNAFSVFYGNASTQPGYYRPLTATYYYVLYTISPNNPYWYHVIQVIVFILNACLVYILLKKFLSKPTAFFLSLVYLVHPMNEATATFISDANGVLYVFFGLSALLIYLYKRKNAYILLLIVAICLLLGLLAKETAIFFFLFIFLYILLFQKPRDIYITTSILGITGLTYLLIRYSFAQGFIQPRSELYPLANFTLWQRIINIPQMLLFYIQHIFYPYAIGVNHLWKIKTITLQNFYFPLLIDVIFLIVSFLPIIYFYYKKEQLLKLYFLFFSVFWISLSFFFTTVYSS